METLEAKVVKGIFPQIAQDIINDVLTSSGGDLQKAVDFLLSMSEEINSNERSENEAKMNLKEDNLTNHLEEQNESKNLNNLTNYLEERNESKNLNNSTNHSKERNESEDINNSSYFSEGYSFQSSNTSKKIENNSSKLDLTKNNPFKVKRTSYLSQNTSNPFLFDPSNSPYLKQKEKEFEERKKQMQLEHQQRMKQMELDHAKELEKLKSLKTKVDFINSMNFNPPTSSTSQILNQPTQYVENSAYTIEQFNEVQRVLTCNDYYQILDLPSTCLQIQIQKQYKKVMLPFLFS